MQDGVPALKSLKVRERLAEVFDNYAVALQHEIQWPPRSPDLTACDRFCGVSMKIWVFAKPPLTFIDFHQRILLQFESWLEQSLLELLLEQWKNILTSVSKALEETFLYIFLCNM